MALLRHSELQTPDPSARTTYGPAWAVPPAFSFSTDVVDVLARRYGRPALVHVAGDGTVDTCTFADIWREGTRWACLLRERTPEPGSRVVIALDPGTPWVGAIVGALRMGLLPIPVGTNLTPGGLAARIAQVDPHLVIVDSRSEAALAEALHVLPVEPASLTLEDAHWDLMRVGTPVPHVDRQVEAPAIVVFTAGGTSGRPRPVVHSSASIYSAFVPSRDWLDAREGDLVWCDEHGGSTTALWAGLFGPWSTGAAVLAIDRELGPDERAGLLERFQPTIAVHSPERHEAFLDELEERDIRLTGLRNAASTGARLSPALARRFLELTGVPLLDGYGTAETGVIAYHHYEGRAPNDSIGVPAAGHLVAPVDDRGMVAAVGVVGDLGIYGRPPSLCSSYWTGWPPGEEQVDGSWTLTGDRAFFDQVGDLRLDDSPAEATPDQISLEDGALLWRAAPIGVGAAMEAAYPAGESALA